MTESEPIYSLKGKRVWVAGHGMVGSALLPTPSARRLYAVAGSALIGFVVSRSPE
jgi:hypothetical protein